MTARGRRAIRNRKVRKWVYVEKGAPSRGAPFLTGEVSLAFLAGLLLPALGFLCHCLLSPPSSGFTCERCSRHREWLPPGTLTRCRPSSRLGTFRAAKLGRARPKKIFLTSLGMA